MKLTTTSYAILGLLDLRDWSAYELAAQASRSLAFTWPVSASQLYAEPKRLADAGLITVHHAAAGPERRRQEYAITDAGRRALRDWLSTEPLPPRLHVEVMLRCLFATSGDLDDLRAAVSATRAAAARTYEAGFGLVDEYLHGDNPFPERLHTNLLWMRLARDLQLTLVDWADRTLEVLDTWSDVAVGPDEATTRAELEALPEPGRRRGI